MTRLALFGLTACALAVPAMAQDSITLPLQGATLETLSYSCDGGMPFEVKYLNAGPNSLAILPVDGAERIFVNVISGSGARYASGQYIWWSKGNTATLENQMEEGSLQDCVADATQ